MPKLKSALTPSSTSSRASAAARIPLAPAQTTRTDSASWPTRALATMTSEASPVTTPALAPIRLTCAHISVVDSGRHPGQASGSEREPGTRDKGSSGGSGPSDRKSVGEGKRVSVRVDSGGRRLLKKNTTQETTLDN